ncbi:MAG: carbon-nitrogen hydrolase family protein [Myxococcales bacterium]|nr:carbon-nitrogen hydrolase family protein [Myxococcales bacterium]
MFLAAAVQMTSTSDAEGNLEQATDGIRRAARYGCSFVATPENTDYLGPHTEKVKRAQTLEGPLCAHYAGLAREHGLHLLLGSFAERSEDPARCYNTSVLFGPDGRILASYRKIHLFDVDVSPETRFKESDTVVPGERVVVAETPLAKVGMSVCYDLRFPELYRALRDAGATLITIPSAFTLTTGKDHWEPLIRARAIETQCYVIAAGQQGQHDDGGLRASWGHSMIVDPWGHVVGMASDGPGLAVAEIDVRRVETVRRGIPLASHRRLPC